MEEAGNWLLRIINLPDFRTWPHQLVLASPCPVCASNNSVRLQMKLTKLLLPMSSLECLYLHSVILAVPSSGTQSLCLQSLLIFLLVKLYYHVFRQSVVGVYMTSLTSTLHMRNSSPIILWIHCLNFYEWPTQCSPTILYRMTALQMEIFHFWFVAVCELQLASCGLKTVSKNTTNSCSDTYSGSHEFAGN